MRLSDFNYELPEELIAQSPPTDRDGARMLVLHRAEQRFEDRLFRDLPEYLRPGDCLVLNNSRVLPSRLLGKRTLGGGAVEVMLLEPVPGTAADWRALVRPGRKMLVGTSVTFGGTETISAEVIAHRERGERVVRFAEGTDVHAVMDQFGHLPLPPYIRRTDNPQDRERYQTVFARERGSVAAPTAGLHFTPEVLARAEAAGATTTQVTLHVGLGTFQPIETENFESHSLHFERYSIHPDARAAIDAARRVIAVGTTSVRTMESAARLGSDVGNTNLFLYPGARFEKTRALLTNFHLPRTSLLLLVCAFAGTEFALAAYRYAVEQKYRFFSYGDCMLIL